MGGISFEHYKVKKKQRGSTMNINEIKWKNFIQHFNNSLKKMIKKVYICIHTKFFTRWFFLLWTVWFKKFVSV